MLTLKQYIARKAAATRAAVLPALKVEREQLRIKAETYKGSAKGKRTARAYQLDDILRREKTSLAGSAALYWIGFDKSPNPNSHLALAQAVEDYISLAKGGDVLTALKKALEQAREYVFMPSDYAVVRRAAYAAALDRMTWAEIEKLYNSPPEGLKLPPLWQWVSKHPDIKTSGISQFLGNAATASADAFQAVRDVLEIASQQNITRNGPAFVVRCEREGFHKGGFYDIREPASAGIFVGAFAAEDRATKFFEQLVPKYGASEDIFTVLVVANFSAFPVVNMTIKAVFIENSQDRVKKAKDGQLSALKHG